MPETVRKSCWGKKVRGQKVREIQKPGHCGDVRLPLCGLPDFSRFSGESCTFFSLLLPPTLQGELKGTVSRKADFPVPFVGMTHLTDDTIRVFALFCRFQ